MESIRNVKASMKIILIDPRKEYRILDETYIMGMFRAQLKLESYADVHRITHNLKPKFWDKWKDIYHVLTGV